MTLIKIYFGNVLTEMTNATYDTLHKIATSETQVNETSLRALLYTKFENAAQPTLRMLLYELEKRAKIEPDEYESLLSECWANWFASRNGLLSDNVTSEVRLLDPNNADLIKLVGSLSYALSKDDFILRLWTDSQRLQLSQIALQRRMGVV